MPHTIAYANTSKATFYNAAAPTTNYGTSNVQLLSLDGSSNPATNCIMAFTTPALATSVKITEALLRFRILAGPWSPGGMTLDVRRCTRTNWVESWITGSTWNDWSAGTGAWTTGGGDYATDAEDLQANVPQSTTGTYVLGDVRNIVQYCVRNALASIDLLLVGNNASTAFESMQWASDDHLIYSPPQLQISYTHPPLISIPTGVRL